MIGFFLKKNFCDGWDNLWFLLIPNIVIVLVCALMFFLLAVVFSITENNPPLLLLCCAIGFILACGIIMVFAMAFGESAAEIANFNTPSNKDYFKQIPVVFKDGFCYGVIMGFLIVVAGVAIPVYNSMGGILGNCLATIVAGFEIVFFLALQWFIPLRALLHNDFKKCIKKCFILFFDNTGFSIFMFFYNVLLAVLSAFIILILPGTAGIVVAQVNALRLRLYKYDWLDANPQYKGVRVRNKIPWDELLKNDRDSLGPRNFKSFFMPWKE